MATVTGGDQIKLKIESLVKDADLRLRVGFLEGSTYPGGASTPLIAAIQEFGAPKVGIPPRPFFRNMIAAKKGEWPKAAANLLKSDFDIRRMLNVLGEGIAGQLQQSIIDTNQPPLSQVTLMLRKMKAENPDLVVTRSIVEDARRRVKAGESVSGVSTKPLVETSHLLKSVGKEVE